MAACNDGGISSGREWAAIGALLEQRVNVLGGCPWPGKGNLPRRPRHHLWPRIHDRGGSGVQWPTAFPHILHRARRCFWVDVRGRDSAVSGLGFSETAKAQKSGGRD